jgi:polyhydroxybutyrate depolymerase
MLLRRALRVAPLALFGALFACATAREGRLGSGDYALELEQGGNVRRYVLHVPARRDADAPLPLLLAFHGGGGNGPGFQEYAGLDAVADREGFAVAYPDGSGRSFERRLLTWNAGGCCGHAQTVGSDDVGFALAVIEDVARRVPLDRARVYATGHSNGAMLAYRLAAEASERIAAVAGVAGAMNLVNFDPKLPVPVLHVHSADDPRAPYGGGTRSTFGRPIHHRAVESELARWRERNGCRGEPREVERREAGGHTATHLAWPCPEGAAVELWRLTGAGHGWPGGPSPLPERVIGPSTTVISAADEVWRFVSGFRR